MKKRDKSKTAEFLRLARERFDQARTEEADLRAEAAKDLRFVWGEQWEQHVRAQRELDGRPCLTFNRLGAFVQQVSNESRLNRVQLKFSPADDASDEETAEVYDGLARHIQYNSRAQIAYETGGDYAASCSFGFTRLNAEYCDDPDRPFDQELKIDAVADPFSVYGVLVPAILRQRCRFAFVVDHLDRKQFEKDYPDASLDGFAGDDSGWLTEDKVRIAEYFYIEEDSKRRAIRAKDADGNVLLYGWEDELGDLSALGEGVEIETRDVVTDIVRWAKITGSDVLEETTWPDSEIPIEAVLGKAAVVEGKPRLKSVIRDAREPQQLFNFYKTTIAETLSDVPRSPWVGILGQFKTHALRWAQAARKRFAFLEYDPVTVAGTLAPPPQRQTYEAPIQALSAAAAQEADAMKATTSIFDAALGARSNETSGIAIARRQKESDSANMHFLDNVKRAYESNGRRIARLIPKFYDTARQVRILGEDEAEKIARVNQPYTDPKTGRVKAHYLDAGKYDVVVSTGPAYNTRREEAFDLLTQMASAYPPLMQIAGDIIFRNSDIPGSDELAERFKRSLPPNLSDKDQQAGQVPPEVKQQLDQAGQMIEQLTAQLNQLGDELESRKYEIDSRERIAMESELTKRTLGMAQLDSAEATVELKEQLALMKADLERMHAQQMAESDAMQAQDSAENGGGLAAAA